MKKLFILMLLLSILGCEQKDYGVYEQCPNCNKTMDVRFKSGVVKEKQSVTQKCWNCGVPYTYTGKDYKVEKENE